VIEGLLRELAPAVIAQLARRYGQFDACEDAVQEALFTASQKWPIDGVPENPRAWLATVASRRLIDEIRSDSARRSREEAVSALEVDSAPLDHDDTLTLLFLCCHPALTAPSQLALTLRAVGGLTTAEIASAFLIPEASMAQRISRAKQTIRAAGGVFEPPSADDRSARLVVVLQVLYLLFNEGYTASSGESLQRSELTTEAIRITRLLRAVAADAEVAGLLALMLLTEARRPARETPGGELVALADQDRTLWNRNLLGEGIELVEATLGTSAIGPYQIQAAIAAVHGEAADDSSTDWGQILALYEVLERVAPGPMVTLNRAVALSRVSGPSAGLALLGTIERDPRMASTHRLAAVRAHLLELDGDVAGARVAYLEAARQTRSTPEQRYLAARAAML
jgi:RNA polymerase sigma factor (sigma-70 family)